MDFSFVPVAYAAGVPLLDASSSYTTVDMIRMAVSLVVFVWGLCSVFFVIWGGMLLILSWWKDDKIRSALAMIRYSIVGIVAIVVAIFVIPKFTELLGIAGFTDFLSPKSIFSTIADLTQRILGDTTASGGSFSFNIY